MVPDNMWMSRKGITLQVNSDGTGQYSDDGQGITLQVSEGGNGIFTDTKKEITMMVSDDSTSYTQGSIDIDVKPDGAEATITVKPV